MFFIATDTFPFLVEIITNKHFHLIYQINHWAIWLSILVQVIGLFWTIYGVRQHDHPKVYFFLLINAWTMVFWCFDYLFEEVALKLLK